MSARDERIATDAPKWSATAPSDAVSFDCSTHVFPVELRNTYAAPRSAAPATSAPGAPTTTESPFIDTAAPNWSPATPSDAVSFATCVQVAPLLRNTYTAP